MLATDTTLFFRHRSEEGTAPSAGTPLIDLPLAGRPDRTPPAAGARPGLGPPSVSVVVPTYRRPEMLRRCLAALAAQSLPPERYEVIVCDDEPGAPTRTVVDGFRAGVEQGGLPGLRYLPVTATQGPAGARNAGWRAALAPVIAFTDDDTIPDPGWLESGLESMTSGVAAATGRIVMPIPDKPSDQQRDAGGLRLAEFATANCFVRTDALEAVGGFDERFRLAWREDSDLHFSLIEQGCRIAWAPRAVVHHPLRPAPFAAGLAMQRKVMFDVLLYRKHRGLYRRRIRKHPPWFYLLVTACLTAAVLALLSGEAVIAGVCAALWLALSLGFFAHRLKGTSLDSRNVADLLLTSLLIPPLSIFWRMAGILRFGWGMP